MQVRKRQAPCRNKSTSSRTRFAATGRAGAPTWGLHSRGYEAMELGSPLTTTASSSMGSDSMEL